MKNIFKVLTLTFVCSLAFGSFALAVSSNVQIADDTVVNLSDLNLNLTLKSGSAFDSMTVNAGNLVVVLSTGSSVVIESNDRRTLSNTAGVSSTCVAGQPSSLTLAASGTVTITPSLQVCDYVVPSGGGGGNSNLGNNNDISSPKVTTTREEKTGEDGTKIVNNIFTTKVNNIVTDSKVESSLSLKAEAKNDQSVSLNTSQVADTGEVGLNLSKEVIKELVGANSTVDAKVVIDANNATVAQKTSYNNQGLFLVGGDVFSINLTIGQEQKKQFNNPLLLSFDVSKISNPEILKVFYFNASTTAWEIVGDGGTLVNGKLQVYTNHLTDFALMKKAEKIEKPIEPAESKTVLPAQPSVFKFKKTLKLGSKNNDVLQLQLRLQKEKYLAVLPEKPNGYFGKGTQQALKNYQRNNRLKQTGILDSPTITKLNKVVNSAVVVAPKLEFIFSKTVKLGSKNNEVMQLQLRLQAEKFLTKQSEKQNGYFGKGTEVALKAYQKKNKLKQTGVLDKATIVKLNKKK